MNVSVCGKGRRFRSVRLRYCAERELDRFVVGQCDVDSEERLWCGKGIPVCSAPILTVIIKHISWIFRTAMGVTQHSIYAAPIMQFTQVDATGICVGGLVVTDVRSNRTGF